MTSQPADRSSSADPCTRPECGGEQHTDPWGTPVQCPHAEPVAQDDTGRRCPRCDCPDGHEQCNHCKACPHAGGTPENPAEPSELDQLRADNESLRYQIRRAREALGGGGHVALHNEPPARPLATIEEIAGYLGVPVATVYAWSSRGGGPQLIKVGRHLRAHWSDIEQWLDEKTITKEPS